MNKILSIGRLLSCLQKSLLSSSFFSSNYPVIISINSSKSNVPDPSSSTSSMIPSSSSSVNLLSISLRISFKVSVDIYPIASLSYIRKASFSSFFKASSSSSTRNFAASWQNSPNSSNPEPSSSISSMISLRAEGLNFMPIIERIPPTLSAGMAPSSSANPSKHPFRILTCSISNPISSISSAERNSSTSAISELLLTQMLMSY